MTCFVAMEGKHTPNYCERGEEDGESVCSPQDTCIVGVSVNRSCLLRVRRLVWTVCSSIKVCYKRWIRVKTYLRNGLVRKLIVMLKDKSSMRYGSV